MTSRSEIEQIITALYAARLGGDVDGTLAAIAEDAQFGLFAQGVGGPGLTAPLKGRPAIRQAVQSLVDAWRFENWEKIDLVVEGEKAVLHWCADVTNVQSGNQARLHCIDLITFRDGKIVDYRQSTDTAMMIRLMPQLLAGA